MIELRSSADPKATAASLRNFARDLENVVGANIEAVDRLNGWRRWVGATAFALSPVLTATALRKHVRGDHYELLQTLNPASYGSQLMWLIDTETQSRIESLKADANELERVVDRWTRFGRGVALVLDTNVLLTFGEHLMRARWYSLTNRLSHLPISVVIPIQVVEELDTQKDRGAPEARTLARMTLKWLDSLFGDGYHDDTIDVAGTARGRCTFRLLVDELDRVPLPRPDADIIDRALALQPFAEEVVIVSEDRSMRFRAKAAGLGAIEMPFNVVPDGKQQPRKKEAPNRLAPPQGQPGRPARTP
ncbi:PIN domain-containing protein [Curtobacterium sp. NPDC089991]|uniref:PIN domain-containing protein n=1 Tax=Curtobacterium sp. NPDC089991 TaxID=3363969 RepID=UPI00381B5B33